MAPSVKKLVIVKYDCWQFANRLWNDMAIYAMGLALGARVSFPPMLERLRWLRPLYELYAQFVGRVLHPVDSVFAWGGTVKYLPPTEALAGKYDRFSSLHFLGMLFRNPEGFVKYEKELKERFGPDEALRRRIEERLTPLSNRILIGVEIRRRPFTYFPDGEFLIPLERTKEAVDEFMARRGLRRDAVGLLIVSDSVVPPTLFADYSCVYSMRDETLGFHLLAQASAVVGTNASRPNLAAWFADAPHVVVTEDPIDWPYYDGRSAFFDNRYATFTQKVSSYS